MTFGFEPYDSILSQAVHSSFNVLDVEPTVEAGF